MSKADRDLLATEDADDVQGHSRSRFAGDETFGDEVDDVQGHSGSRFASDETFGDGEPDDADGHRLR